MFRRLRYGLEMRGARRRGVLPATAGRTWVHPSELPGPFDRAELPPPRPVVARRLQVAVASAASLLLATGGVLLAASATAPAGATVGPHVAASLSALPLADRAAAGSLVCLELYENQHLGTATAMVLPPGNLAVTTAAVPAHAAVDGWSAADGWMTLSVVGADPALGVTVLRLPATLPAMPTTTLGNALNTGGAPTTLTALAAIPGADVPVDIEYASAYLASIDSPVTVAGTVLSTSSGDNTAGVISGSVLVDASGRAVAVPVPALGDATFVPAQFLVQLAERLVHSGANEHGWLQIQGTGDGIVEWVAPGGASAGQLEAGDRILAIDGQSVGSIADVDSVLYTLVPGTRVHVLVDRGNRIVRVTVRLAPSP